MASVNHLPRLRTVATLGFLLAVAACAGASSGSNAPTPGRVIPFERIQSSGARNAWEALRKTVPHFRFSEDQGTRPTGVQSGRGRTSPTTSSAPLIFVDERRVFDLGELRRMPVADINSIHVLSAIEGTTRYGTDAAHGVIVIRTRNR